MKPGFMVHMCAEVKHACGPSTLAERNLADQLATENVDDHWII